MSGLFNPADFKGTPYTGLLLDEDSREKLRGLVPKGWKFLGHHMVLNMGPLDTTLNRPANLGRRYKMVAHVLASNDKVVAVGVWSPLKTVNARPHIVVALNKGKDGQASDANGLIGWKKLRPTIELEGTVAEFGINQTQVQGRKAPRAKRLSNSEMFGPIQQDSPFAVLKDILKRQQAEDAEA